MPLVWFLTEQLEPGAGPIATPVPEPSGQAILGGLGLLALLVFGTIERAKSRLLAQPASDNNLQQISKALRFIGASFLLKTSWTMKATTNAHFKVSGLWTNSSNNHSENPTNGICLLPEGGFQRSVELACVKR
jgi:hypothetical protein